MATLFGKRLLRRPLVLPFAMAFVVFVGAAAVAIAAPRARDGLFPNLVAEALGVSVSVIVGVFIIDRAISGLEAERRKPLTQQVMSRIIFHSQMCISELAKNLPLRSPDDRTPRKERLVNALNEQLPFNQLDDAARQAMYTTIARSRDVIKEELEKHQVVFTWYPDLYRTLVEVDYRVLEWSVYRDTDEYPLHEDERPTAEEESPMIARVAQAFITLHDLSRPLGLNN